MTFFATDAVRYDSDIVKQKYVFFFISFAKVQL